MFLTEKSVRLTQEDWLILLNIFELEIIRRLHEIEDVVDLAKSQAGDGVSTAIVDGNSPRRLIVKRRARKSHIGSITHTLI